MRNKPSVPYTFETLAELQARYAKALEAVYDVAAMVTNNAIRPGEVAAQVFDFDDGLRLLVSRDRMKIDGTLALHVSASFRDECRIADEFRLLMIADNSEQRRLMLMRKWVASIPARWAELAQDNGPPIELIGWTAAMIPHWVRDEESQVPA